MENYKTLLVSLAVLFCIISILVFLWKVKTYDKEWNKRKLTLMLDEEKEKIVKEFEEAEKNNLMLLSKKEQEMNKVIEKFILENKNLSEENDSLKSYIKNLDKELEEEEIEFDEDQ